MTTSTQDVRPLLLQFISLKNKSRKAEKGRSLALKENSFQDLGTWGNSSCEESFGSSGTG